MSLVMMSPMMSLMMMMMLMMVSLMMMGLMMMSLRKMSLRKKSLMMMMMMMMMMMEVVVMEGSCKTHHCSIWVSATNPDLSSSSTSKRVLRSTRQKFLSQSIFRRNVLNCMVVWEGCFSIC